MQGGIYVAFGVCGIFFIVALFAMYWALKNGEFDDVEGSKFEMLDDDENSVLVRQARARVERARASK
jgi:cbb3-type cytochrome oxidase maturation protein